MSSPDKLGLIEHPGRFTFLQAVRLLLRMRGLREEDFVNEEAVRRVLSFRCSISLSRPLGPIEDVVMPLKEGPVTLTCTAGGLTGTSGTLPEFYTDILIARERKDDGALRDFLDIFNNRWIGLYYQVLERSALVHRGGEERGSGTEEWLGCFLGRALDRDPKEGLGSGDLVSYVGLWTQSPRSAQVLEQILGDFLGGTEVRVEEFVGRWAAFAPQERARLESAGWGTALDGASAIGERMWDIQGRIRIWVGPVGLDIYQRLQPGEDLLYRVEALSREYLGDRLSVQLVPTLERRQVPACQVTTEGDEPRLGRTACLDCGHGVKPMVGPVIDI